MKKLLKEKRTTDVKMNVNDNTLTFNKSIFKLFLIISDTTICMTSIICKTYIIKFIVFLVSFNFFWPS